MNLHIGGWIRLAANHSRLPRIKRFTSSGQYIWLTSRYSKQHGQDSLFTQMIWQLFISPSFAWLFVADGLSSRASQQHFGFHFISSPVLITYDLALLSPVSASCARLIFNRCLALRGSHPLRQLFGFHLFYVDNRLYCLRSSNIFTGALFYRLSYCHRLSHIRRLSTSRQSCWFIYLILCRHSSLLVMIW